MTTVATTQNPPPPRTQPATAPADTSCNITVSTAPTAGARAPGKRARIDSLAPRDVQRSAEPAAGSRATPPAAFADIDLADRFALHLMPVQRAAERAGIAAEPAPTGIHAAAARGTGRRRRKEQLDDRGFRATRRRHGRYLGDE